MDVAPKEPEILPVGDTPEEYRGKNYLESFNPSNALFELGKALLKEPSPQKRHYLFNGFLDKISQVTPIPTEDKEGKARLFGLLARNLGAFGSVADPLAVAFAGELDRFFAPQFLGDYAGAMLRASYPELKGAAYDAQVRETTTGLIKLQDNIAASRLGERLGISATPLPPDLRLSLPLTRPPSK